MLTELCETDEPIPDAGIRVLVAVYDHLVSRHVPELTATWMACRVWAPSLLAYHKDMSHLAHITCAEGRHFGLALDRDRAPDGRRIQWVVDTYTGDESVGPEPAAGEFYSSTTLSQVLERHAAHTAAGAST